MQTNVISAPDENCAAVAIAPPADYVLKVLRKRVGLSDDDASRDADFATYSPFEKLAELVAWNLGYASWSSHFAAWSKACGIILEGNDERALSQEMMLEVLRKRSGLKHDDFSQDANFASLQPLEKLRMLAGWELGYSEWADNYVRWARDCNVQVTISP
jgi:hypothetical protein